jgi:hypothetical protein
LATLTGRPSGVRRPKSNVWGGEGTLNYELGTLNWRSTFPHQHLPIFVDGHPFGLDQFVFEIGQCFLIQLKLALQRAIGHPLLTF